MNILELRARFKLENEVSSDMSYFWYSDVVEMELGNFTLLVVDLNKLVFNPF